MTLLGALEDPSKAAALPAEDPGVVAVARHHRLSPLLSMTCGETLPAPLAEAFRRDRVVTAARNMILGQAAEECLRALDVAGIPTIVLKGLDYEIRLYGAPGARPTADVDLLVPEEKRRAAFGVLDRLGFEPRAAAPGFDDPDYHEVAWTRAGVEIDLHLALAPLARCRIDYSAIWGQAEPLQVGATETRALARPHAAIFQALHMAIDHFDVPAIYLVDLARLLPTAADIAAALRAGTPVALPTAVGDGAVAHGGDAPALGRSPDVRRAHSPRCAAGDEETMARRNRCHARSSSCASCSTSTRAGDAVRYVAVQSRRNLREIYERRVRRRSPRERLALAK